MGSRSKPDTSAQDAQIAKQQKQLDEQRKQAELEAGRLRDQRISTQKRLRGRLSGRRSLIATGELGTKDKLG